MSSVDKNQTVAQAADSVTAPAPPPECETEAEKRAFAFGWFKALESERMKAESAQEDAARYQWIRGPVEESTRYSRWRIEYWDGPNGWQPMQRERMDAAIDAARKQGEK